MVEQQNHSGVRLNKFLAERLGISRREADEKIKAGQVTINGETASIGNRVDKNDKVCYNKESIPSEVEFVYYAFHKPVGYVCSRNKQGKDPTIYEILPESMQGLKNVGRLDRTSSGIILLTNDGDFGFQLTHPQFVKQKIYEVTLHKPLKPADRRKITEEGVEIADGISRFEIADNLHPSDDDTPLKQRRLQRRAKQAALRESLAAAAKVAKQPEEVVVANRATATSDPQSNQPKVATANNAVATQEKTDDPQSGRPEEAAVANRATATSDPQSNQPKVATANNAVATQEKTDDSQSSRPEEAVVANKATTAQVSTGDPHPDGLHLIATLTEGRNRQIRRTFAALGYNVITLHRIKFGDYELGNLQPGQWRKIEK